MKTVRVLLIIVAVIVIIPLLGFLGWKLKKGTALDIVVINKSMTHFSGSENSSLEHILNEEKIRLNDYRMYDLSDDHYGLHMKKDRYSIIYPRLSDIDHTAERANLVYIADLQGLRSSQLGKTEKPEENKLIYGGINNTDYLLIKKLIEKKTPLLAECSFFCAPSDPLVRFNLEKLTDMYYVGWFGCYLPDLAEEPQLKCGYNWQKIYKENTGSDWTSSGPGVVLINPANNIVLLLEEGEDINTGNGMIKTNEKGITLFNLPERVAYQGWFSVMHPGKNEVLSEFILEPTETGHKKLNEAGLPANFPALIHVDENFYFMTGDFGKNRVNPFFSKMVVLNRLHDQIKSNNELKPENFFYTYFQPVVSSLVKQAKASVQNVNEEE